MNKSVIKEVKSIYSNKIRTKNPVTLTAEIKSIKPETKNSKTFSALSFKTFLMADIIFLFSEFIIATLLFFIYKF